MPEVAYMGPMRRESPDENELAMAAERGLVWDEQFGAYREAEPEMAAKAGPVVNQFCGRAGCGVPVAHSHPGERPQRQPANENFDLDHAPARPGDPVEMMLQDLAQSRGVPTTRQVEQPQPGTLLTADEAYAAGYRFDQEPLPAPAPRHYQPSEFDGDLGFPEAEDYPSELISNAAEMHPAEVDPTRALLNERGKTHGDFSVHALVTQSLKTTIYAHMDNPPPPYVQEALDMICHKIGRVVAGKWDFKDHWDDIAGYAKLVSDRCSE